MDTLAGPPPVTTDATIDHSTLYVYSYINYPPSLTLTLGGSADFLEGATVDRTQFNPKFGLIWDPPHHQLHCGPQPSGRFGER